MPVSWHEGRMVMVHANPEQTPEAYAAELDAWWNERKAARREAQR